MEAASSWTPWTRSRRSTWGQKNIHRLDTRPALKLWRGLHAKKARADHGPANDIARRHPAAKDALHVALSWKGLGRLASEWCSMHPAKRDTWADFQITRIAVIEANLIRSALRTWKHWCAWCLEQGEDPLQPTGAAPVAFLCTAAQTRQARHAPRTVPTTRFNHLRWIATNMGAPCG